MIRVRFQGKGCSPPQTYPNDCVSKSLPERQRLQAAHNPHRLDADPHHTLDQIHNIAFIIAVTVRIAADAAALIGADLIRVDHALKRTSGQPFPRRVGRVSYSQFHLMAHSKRRMFLYALKYVRNVRLVTPEYAYRQSPRYQGEMCQKSPCCQGYFSHVQTAETESLIWWIFSRNCRPVSTHQSLGRCSLDRLSRWRHSVFCRWAKVPQGKSRAIRMGNSHCLHGGFNGRIYFEAQDTLTTALFPRLQALITCQDEPASTIARRLRRSG
jgi:hypothetical protein